MRLRRSSEKSPEVIVRRGEGGGGVKGERVASSDVLMFCFGLCLYCFKWENILLFFLPVCRYNEITILPSI